MRVISMPPGIGDGLWVLQKLINANERFIFRIPDGRPQRGHQVFELLPQTTHSWYYDRFKFSRVRLGNAQRQYVMWENIKEQDFYLEANTHLEGGNRIEGFLPDLPTSFKIDFVTTEKHKEYAKNVFKYDLPLEKKSIGIFTSSIGSAQNWKGWELKEWMEYATLMRKEYDCSFVLFGADWDSSLIEPLAEAMRESHAPFILVYKEELGTAIEVMKRLDYFIGFPSGMSVINELIGKDGLMFYSKEAVGHLGIINSWADPKRITNGNIKECFYTTPENIFNWFKQNHDFQK